MIAQFSATLRYLGSDGCCFVLRDLVDQRSPDSPLYSTDAASLPCFLLGLDAFEDETQRHCSGMLAVIDFFCRQWRCSAAGAGSTLAVLSFYNAIFKEAIDHDHARAGLYRRPHWHPQVIAMPPDDQGLLQADLGL